MVRIIELENQKPILQPSVSTIRLVTGHTCLICYLVLMVFGQYTSYVYYRTSQCVYPSVNVSHCSRCENNYIDKHFLTVTEPQFRAAELMWLLFETHLFAIAILFNALGIYFFNFFFIGLFLGFQFANSSLFVINCFIYIGADFIYFVFGDNKHSILFWFSMYTINMITVTFTAILLKEYLKVRQMTGEI